MKIVIKETKSPDIVQITTHDERHYYNKERNIFAPSVNWIIQYYPKGIRFLKWLASKGWDESQAILEIAGNKGSKVHQAIEILEMQGYFKIDELVINPTTNELEELEPEEYECLMSFVDWYNETKPEIIKSEQVVWYDDGNIRFAGTLDRIYKIGSDVVLVDFKTGQDIWTENELQISAYRKAVEETGLKIHKIAILQIGYKRNKRGWKFTEIEDRWDLFLNTYQIWKFNNPDTKVYQKDYPIELRIKEKNNEKENNSI